MKSKVKFSLILAPFLIVFGSLVHLLWRTPSFIHGSDPEYIYLFCSLRILDGLPIIYFDHPGVPFQYLGAGIVFVKWLISRTLGVEPNSIAVSVIKDPESYLFVWSVVLHFMLFFGLYFVGLQVLRATKSIRSVWITQLAFALSFTIFFQFNRVMVENLLSIISLLIMGMAIREIFAPEDDILIYPRISNRNSVFCGILVGLGIMSKVTFFPYLIFVLIFRKKRARVLFLIAALLTTVVCLIPIWTHLEKLIIWITVILKGNQGHGEGQSGWPTQALLLARIKDFWQYDPQYYLLFIWNFMAASVFVSRRKIFNEKRRNFLVRILILGLLLQTSMCVISVKISGAHHYQMSYQVLSVFLVLVSLEGLSTLFERSVEKIRRFYLMGISAAVVATFYQTIVFTRNIDLKWVPQLLKYEDCRNVKHSEMRALFDAFSLGDTTNGWRYKSLIKQIYPNSMVYTVYGGIFSEIPCPSRLIGPISFRLSQ